MQIISIDVGIKNLAYCIIEINNNIDINDNNYKIIKWGSINLCGEEMKCDINTIKKGDICGKKATYTKNNINYCQTHAKKTAFIIPNKVISSATIKKKKMNDLIEFAKKYKIVINENEKKENILTPVLEYISIHAFDIIGKTSANQLDLVTIGIALKTEFDKILPTGNINIDHVVIENQISPIANRMKTIQGMIAQYFIMYNIPKVTFISAMNKLKLFIENNGIKTEYKDRKKMGINITTGLLQYKNVENDENDENSKWILFFSTHKKKDDLADAFLQGLWVLNNNYNLTINYKHS